MAIHKVKISDAVEEYSRFNQARGLKPASVRNQKEALSAFARDAGDIYLCNVTPMHIERHIASKDWKATTRNLKVGHLRTFFQWADKRSYKDPSNDLLYGWRNLKESKVERLRIPAHEWPRLFAACTFPTETAGIAIGLYTFVRVSEAANLRVGDVRFHDNTIAVYRSKTESFDELPMSTELEHHLRSYLTWYANHLAERGIELKMDHYLLPPRKAESVNWLVGTGEVVPTRQHTALGVLTKKVILAAGFDRAYAEEGLGTHTLRRSGARALFDRLVEDGYDGALKTVQAMLGHASTSMTERYLGLELDRKRRNDLLAGKPMFPGLQATNVTQIRREA